jgi:hypothetical protein
VTDFRFKPEALSGDKIDGRPAEQVTLERVAIENQLNDTSKDKLKPFMAVSSSP